MLGRHDAPWDGDSDEPGIRLTSTELYHPSNGSWTAARNMVLGRAAFTTALLPDGEVLVMGGEGGGDSVLASAELYDPGSGS